MNINEFKKQITESFEIVNETAEIILLNNRKGDFLIKKENIENLESVLEVFKDLQPIKR